MNKTVVIVLNTATGAYTCYGNFKKACLSLKLPYHYLKNKRQKPTASIPVTHSGYSLYRVSVE